MAFILTVIFYYAESGQLVPARPPVRSKAIGNHDRLGGYESNLNLHTCAVRRVYAIKHSIGPTTERTEKGKYPSKYFEVPTGETLKKSTAKAKAI